MSVDMTVWQGRSDPEDGNLGLRWHEVIKPADEVNDAGIMLLGFACDEAFPVTKAVPGL